MLPAVNEVHLKKSGCWCSELGLTRSELLELNDSEFEKRVLALSQSKRPSVLRIQGGGSYVRDVWDILAQAAEEIEDLYENKRDDSGRRRSQQSEPSNMGPRLKETTVDVPARPMSLGGDATMDRSCPMGNATFNVEPRVESPTCGGSCPRGANQTYNLSDRSETFSPHPALMSTMIRQDGRAPYFRNYSETALYSDMDDLFDTAPRSRTYSVGQTRSAGRTFLASPNNRTYDVCPANRTYTQPNRTFDVPQGAGPNATYNMNDVCGYDQPYNVYPSNRTYNACSMGKNQTYNVSRGASGGNRTFNVEDTGGCCNTNRTYNAPRCYANETFNIDEQSQFFQPNPVLASTPQKGGQCGNPTYIDQTMELSSFGESQCEAKSQAQACANDACDRANPPANQTYVQQCFKDTYDASARSSAGEACPSGYKKSQSKSSESSPGSCPVHNRRRGKLSCCCKNGRKSPK